MSEPIAASLLERALILLREQVEIPSFTHHRDGVVALAGHTAAMFQALGFQSSRVPSVTPTCGDHLTLTRDAGPDAPRLVLVSHLDTVFPPGTDFPWRELDDGDWIEGPGSCDIKGGTVLMWMALESLARTNPARFDAVSWTLVFNASEEGGCSDFPGIVRTACEAPNVRACLVYEAGMEDGDATTLVNQRKGCGRFRMTAHGYPAHSGNAHPRGASAIRELARAIEKIEALTDYDTDQTFSVGLIRGGTAVNSIADRAEADIDVRSWTVEAELEAERELRAIAAAPSVVSGDGRRACSLDVERLPGYPPWPENVWSRELGERAERIGRELGFTLRAGKRRGGSDGCWTWDLVPTIDGLGPVGRATHTLREAVKRSSFVPRALLSVRLFEELTA